MLISRRLFSKRMLHGSLCSALTPAWAGAIAGKPRPQLSCMLWTLENKAPFDRCLEIVAQAGYQGVELVGEFTKWSPEEIRRTMTRLGSLGLVVDAASGVKAGFAVPDPDGSFLAQVKAQLASMQSLACRRLILLSGAVMREIPPEKQRDIALANLTKAADLAAPQGVEILIEPIDVLEQPTVYLRSVRDAFDLVRALRRPEVKVLYDLYHEQRGSGNLIEKLEANLDLIGLVHVADVPGRHEPGTGEIDYSVVYSHLAQRGYAGWIAMEFYPTGDPVASLRKARLQVDTAYSA